MNSIPGSEISPQLLRDLKVELASLQMEKQERLRTNQISRYQPYTKQLAFHGLTSREGLLMAGNQLGKTYSGGANMTYHLTGEYPDWWEGKRYDHPIRAWAGSVTNEVTRDSVQRILLGDPSDKDARGTGMIPKRLLNMDDVMSRPGVPNAIASITVKHKSGGNSSLVFKSYDQGRTKWQGDTVHEIWLDEEPPMDVYMEALARITATRGQLRMTFTPLLGMSKVVLRFLKEKSEDRQTVRMTIDDAGHISEEEKAKIIAGYPAHEREARIKGIPALGSGRVFPVTEEQIKVKSTPELEAHLDSLPAIAALDFGWDHPTAGVELRHDRDADIVYVRRTARMREATPVFFAAQVKPWGDWIPWAWPHDGLQHDKGSGDQLAAQYEDAGLEMLEERATFEDGTNGVEAGIMLMLDRMNTGRLKVLDHLEDWFEEFRLYHRKDGVIVKEVDDLMAATRYGIMMLREAVYKPVKRRRGPGMTRIG